MIEVAMVEVSEAGAAAGAEVGSLDECSGEVAELDPSKSAKELDVRPENLPDQIGELDWLNHLPAEIGKKEVFSVVSIGGIANALTADTMGVGHEKGAHTDNAIDEQKNQSDLLNTPETQSALERQMEKYQKTLDENSDLSPEVRQAYQEKIDACKTAMEQMKNGKDLTRAQKGNLGEMMMDLDYLQNDCIRMEGKDGGMGVTDLNQPGSKGIDGVYESADPPPQFIIADAKFGSAQLNKDTNDGPQMSEGWIDSRLDGAVGKDKADEIRLAKLENPESVQSQLVKISPTGEMRTVDLDEVGNVKKGAVIDA